jgi:hypothetical protein
MTRGTAFQIRRGGISLAAAANASRPLPEEGPLFPPTLIQPGE